MVAIDGPAGAGKSTVARAVAERLGFAYLDTGAMYRALTWLALERGADPADGDAMGALARREEIRLTPGPAGLGVSIAGREVTREIRAGHIAEHVSVVASHAAVRAAMVSSQRRITATGSWVADGRDVGTVVRPDADLKIFLTADIDVRARRRHAEIDDDGLRDLETVRAELEARDHIDSTREQSPLVAAADAVVIDTSSMSIAEVVEDVVGRVAAVGPG